MTHALHYIAAYTQRLPDGREQAVCGTFITAQQIAPTETLPTCPGCRVWVENLDRIVASDEPYGISRRTA